VAAETFAGRNTILIDDAQVSPTHLGWILVTRKGEGMKAFKPSMIGVTTILRFANDHICCLIKKYTKSERLSY
jgi:hypothetical protein